MGSDKIHKDKKREKRRRSPDNDDGHSKTKPKKRKKEKKERRHSKGDRKKMSKEDRKKVKKSKRNDVEESRDVAGTSSSASSKPTAQLIPGAIHKEKRVMVPMTKEEYERQQSIVRRVPDPETGRMRLVKGDGEIIEEIVSRTRHKEINKQATRGDGQHFQSVLGL